MRDPKVVHARRSSVGASDRVVVGYCCQRVRRAKAPVDRPPADMAHPAVALADPITHAAGREPSLRRALGVKWLAPADRQVWLAREIVRARDVVTLSVVVPAIVLVDERVDRGRVAHRQQSRGVRDAPPPFCLPAWREEIETADDTHTWSRGSGPDR
jgi:hypothetical protein